MSKAVTKIGQIKKGISSVKILTTEDITEQNKYKIKENAKHSEMGQAIVQTYPDLDFDNFDTEKFVHIRAAFVNFLESKTTGEIYTRLELNNICKLSKELMLARLHKKLQAGILPDDLDLKRLDKVIEQLLNLDKVKHGEKKIIAKMDFSYVRDLT